MDFLTTEQVLYIHARLLEETGGEHGVRDLGLLISAIERPKATFDRKDLYPDLFTKAAALLDALIRNHPFVDGNKRTGVVSAGLFLVRNGYAIAASNEELASFTLAYAQSQLSIDQIARWLETHCDEISAG
jgi:death-on-curing protein